LNVLLSWALVVPLLLLQEALPVPALEELRLVLAALQPLPALLLTCQRLFHSS